MTKYEIVLTGDTESLRDETVPCPPCPLKISLAVASSRNLS